MLFLGMARHGFLVVVKNIFPEKGHEFILAVAPAYIYLPVRMDPAGRILMYFDSENTFSGTSLHFLWTWTLLLDLTTILLEMATLLLDLHTLLLDLILPSCSTWPFPKPYPF